METQYQKYGNMYIPSALLDAVNFARYLGVPLLLEGEPGIGKTTFAKNLALRNGYDLFFVSCKGVEDYNELIAAIDYPSLVADALSGKLKDRGSLKRYLRLGPVGLAFKASNQRKILLLLNEFDKLPTDVMNSFLDELSEGKIIFLDREIKANIKNMIIIITSNASKPIPNTIISRSIYFRIEFPEDINVLVTIASMHDIEERFSRPAADYIINLRKSYEGYTYVPGIREFLQVAKLMQRFQTTDVSRFSFVAMKKLYFMKEEEEEWEEEEEEW